MKRRLITLGEVLAAVLAMEGAAQACGGVFCDTGPQSMPVDQTGENILFVMDGTNVEAHIQIAYAGAASRFAWVIPMPTVPTVSVGSKALFNRLLAGTVPTYGYSQQIDCPSYCGVGCGGGACGSGSSHASSSSTGGPQVDFQETVGAFTVTALSGGTAQEVSDWLTTNGYASPASAPNLLQTYVAKNYVFVAAKLNGVSGVDEIHPLVLKYPGNMPCVPLVLTAVAARDNMGVRAFFLGDHRAYAENWKMVTLNTVRLDWLGFGDNYDVAVAHAVDEAGGHAWISEYSGTSSVVNASGLYSAAWISTPFQTIAPQDVVTQLETEQLAFCTAVTCSWQHPLLLGLLHQYLPPPAGVTDDAWYSDLPGQAAQIDPIAWNASAFAADFDARIVQPAMHARDVLQQFPRLTRLFTRISPSEMTEDPTFQVRGDLDANTDVHRHTATLETTCQNERLMKLPETDRVITVGNRWPIFSDKMPWAEEIYRVPPNKPPVVLLDNGPLIDRLLDSGAEPISTPGLGPSPGAVGGCGCRVAPLDSPGWLVLLGAAGFVGVVARRARRPRPR